MLKRILLGFFQFLLCCVFVFGLLSCSSKKGDLLFSGITDSGLTAISYKNEKELAQNKYQDSNLVGTTYVINLYGKEYEGVYYDTIIFPYYRCAVDYYEYSENNKFVLLFGISRFSNNLVYFLFDDTYPCVTDKNTGLSCEECRQIAIEKLYEYDSDIVFTEKEVQDDYLKNIYKFMFVRTIDGVETSARFIVSVNTDGVIIMVDSDNMPSFDNLGSKEQRVKNIDETDLNEQIEKKLSTVLEGWNYEKWEIKGRTLHILNDGAPCIEYEVLVLLDPSGIEIEGSNEEIENWIGVRFIKML